MTGPLAGRLVALPETRELDRLAELLEREGARTLRCPLVAILDAPDPGPVDAWIDALIGGAFDDLIFLTGEGLRRLLARAEATDKREAFVSALTRARKVTRGPKPARALHELGLSTDLAATVPTSQGVADALAALDMKGRRVGLQLYGTDPNDRLVAALASQGAVVRTVAPYIYAPAIDEVKVVDLVQSLARGDVDVLAFTSASQADRLWAVAETRKIEDALRAGLQRTKVAAVGPIARESLEARGVTVAIDPGKPFVLKNLVAAIVRAAGG
jgi:uroporphyrinogen-III synthase